MANRQIGWSQESNLLWQIGNQIDRLTGVTSKISGGSSTTIVVTKTEIDALIASSSLVPGNVYIISGVDVPLYGGTTIMLQAATTNELALAGHGVFYNPKYLNSQLTPFNGYGIWSNYITLTMLSIVGTFTNGDTVTANNGATATYLTRNFLSWISGDWSAATSISNGSGATANVSGVVSPSYAIGQDVIWGGKHWTNISGAVGTATDKYTLSAADWTSIPFNATDYNVEIDIIHYDYLHDMIIRRKDRWDNDVDGNFQVFDEFASPGGFGYGNPIKDFQWGNGNDDWNTDDYEYIGVQSNYVKDSYFECINFIGESLWFNRLTQFSFIHNNITDVNSYVQYNTLTGSYIDGNTLTYSSNIYNNTLTDDSYINNNTLTASSNIRYNVINSSFIEFNTLNGFGNIASNTLTNNSNIINNTLSTFSSLNNNTLTNISTFNFSSSGTLSNRVIQYIETSYADATFNIFAATIIYGNYSKQMFRNSSGVTKLAYYNASNVFTVVNVNA